MSAGISVVTATRGRPDLLLRKGHALAAQTLSRERFEWIVAFDGADPDLTRRLRSELGDVLRMRTVVAPGLGPGPARDAAAREARGDVLYLSDDDCLPHPRALALHLEAQARPAVYLGTVVFEDDDGRETWWSPRHPGWWNLGGANASVPRRAFAEVGGFGSDLTGYGGEDLWLGWRLHRSGVAIRGLPRATVLHRGAPPERVATRCRARQAGANAVRIARMEPRLAWRLGVHPWLLGVKRALLPPFARVARVRSDLAYTDAAWAAWREDGDEGNATR